MENNVIASNEINEKYSRKRWLFLITCCLASLTSGSMYSWSVLATPMAAELGVSNLATVYSVANSVGFITMIIGGILNDKYGPRWVMFTGGIMFGGGMLASGFANSVGFLIVSYGLVLGLGLSFVYGSAMNNTLKYFPDKKGLIGGIVSACYGLSSALTAALAEIINNAYGVRVAFKILGIAFIVVICFCALFNERCPEGFMPKGYVPQKNSDGNEINLTPKQMLKQPAFYLMFFMLFCGGTAGMMIISNAKSLGMEMVGLSTTMAALLVSVLSIFNTAGRLIAGFLSDRIGANKTLALAIEVGFVGMVMLFISESAASSFAFTLGIMLVGLCFGNFLGVYPGFCTGMFGRAHNTLNYGIMWIGFSLSGLVAPLILSGVHDATGFYKIAFVVAGAILAAGFVLNRMFDRSEKLKSQK